MSVGDLIGMMAPEWADHGRRVGSLTRSIADTLGLDDERVRRLEIAAVLHDIGKTHIDPNVLALPRALNPEETALVRRHPLIGFEMVTGLVHPEIARAVLAHHERFDGLGYPFGRSGQRIPFLARILSVADAFDAIVSDRVYQEARPIEYALNELQRYAGTQFDPLVVEAALHTLSSRPSFAGAIA